MQYKSRQTPVEAARFCCRRSWADQGPAAAYDALDYWFYGPGVMRLYFPEDLARLPRPERDDWRALWDDVLAAQVKALGH